MPHVKMIQETNNRWRIETHDGKIVLDDIIVYNKEMAEEFVKAYVSSFPSWTYELEEKWKK